MVLAARDGSVAPAAVRLVASAAAGSKSRWDKVRFKPSKVTIRVTRGKLWPFDSNDREKVKIVGVGEGVALSDDKALDTNVAPGDDGGRARITLLPRGEPTGGTLSTVVKASDVSGAGKFSGAPNGA